MAKAGGLLKYRGYVLAELLSSQPQTIFLLIDLMFVCVTVPIKSQFILNSVPADRLHQRCDFLPNL